MNEMKLKLTLDPDIDANKLNVILRALRQSLGELGRNISLIDPEKLKSELRQIDGALGGVASTSKEVDKVMRSAFSGTDFLGAAFKINQVTQLMSGLAAGLGETSKPFIDFQAELAELSAITGVSGKDLELFGDKARELAKSFGGDAVGQLDAFKGVLSRLGPDLAKSPQAMEQMTIAINTLAKAGGLDAAQSMDALTTTMLQFGISLDDPMQAASEATRIINILAAGAKEGAAEIPQVSEALTVTGVAAKAFNMSIEETNASIQALATGGKYGAEAGTALRNVLGKMAGEEVIPKEALAKLKSLGVDMKVVSDKTLPFADRLKELSKAAGDATAFAQVFGTENAAAATILANSADKVADFTLKLTGTNVAFDQAAINMDTIAGKTDRFKAAINDFLIGVGQTLGTAFLTSTQAANQIMPLALTLGQMRAVLPTEAFKNLAANIVGKLVPAAVTGDVATKALNVSFKTLAKTILTHPLFWAFAAVTGVVAAIKLVSDALHTTAVERKADADAEIKSIQYKQQANLEDQKRVKSNMTLLDQYHDLASKKKRSAEEELKLQEVTASLNKEMPGVIQNTSDFGANLNSVAAAAAKSYQELEELRKTNKKLADDMQEASITQLKASRDVEIEAAKNYAVGLKQEINIATGAFQAAGKFVDMITDKVTSESVSRDMVTKLFDQFNKDLNNAKSRGDIAKIQVALTKALYGSGTQYSQAEANKLMTHFKNAMDIQYKLLPKGPSSYLDELRKQIELEQKKADAIKLVNSALSDQKISVQDSQVLLREINERFKKTKKIAADSDKDIAASSKKAEEDKQKDIAAIQAKWAEDMRIAYLESLAARMAEGEQKEKFLEEIKYRKSLNDLQDNLNQKLAAEGITDEMRVQAAEEYTSKVETLDADHQKALEKINQDGIDKMQSDYEGSEEGRTKKLGEEQKKREEIERKQLEFFNDLQPSMDKVFAKLTKSLLKFKSDADGNITGVKLTFDELGKTIEENAGLIITSMAAALGQAVTDHKSATKMIAQAALDTLNALVPVLAATITGYSLATPQSIATAGVWGVIQTAGLMAILYGAVGIARNAVQSLATGGRIDEPTLAIIGDASRARPGSNTEWVLRDDQIGLIVQDSILKAFASINGTTREGIYNDILMSFSEDINRLVGAIASLRPLFAESEFNLEKIVEFSQAYSGYRSLRTDYLNNRIAPDEYARLNKPLEIKLRSFAEGGTVSRPEVIIAGDSSRGPEHILDSPALQEVIMASNKLMSPEFLEEFRQIREAIYNISIKVGDETIYNSYNKTDTRRRTRYRT